MRLERTNRPDLGVAILAGLLDLFAGFGQRATGVFLGLDRDPAPGAALSGPSSITTSPTLQFLINPVCKPVRSATSPLRWL